MAKESQSRPDEEYPENVHKVIEKARCTSVLDCMSNQETFTVGVNNDQSYLPPWLDLDAIKRGKDYVPVRMLLVKTGKSHTQDLALRRYLSTLLHVKLWYEGDLSVLESEAVRDVLKVRKIHAGVSKRLEMAVEKKISADLTCCDSDDLKKSNKIIKVLRDFNLDYNNNVMMSLSVGSNVSVSQITQLDMIVTQYGFMGLITTFPKKFGILTEEDMQGLSGFTHIWAVIGHLLGIQDEFNLCIGENTKMKEYILKEILLRDLFATKEETYRLWKALVSAMSEFVPCLSINAALLYILEHTLQLNTTDKLYSVSSVYEKFCYHLMIILFTCLFNKLPAVRMFLNNCLRLAIYITRLRLNFLKMVICMK